MLTRHWPTDRPVAYWAQQLTVICNNWLAGTQTPVFGNVTSVEQYSRMQLETLFFALRSCFFLFPFSPVVVFVSLCVPLVDTIYRSSVCESFLCKQVRMYGCTYISLMYSLTYCVPHKYVLINIIHTNIHWDISLLCVETHIPANLYNCTYFEYSLQSAS